MDVVDQVEQCLFESVLDGASEVLVFLASLRPAVSVLEKGWDLVVEDELAVL